MPAHTWIYENGALTHPGFGGSVFDHREIRSPGGIVVVIHRDFNIGTVETRQRALDPKNITTLPNDILTKG